MTHARCREYVLAHVVEIILAAGAFDRAAEQHIAVVAVAPFGAGREFRRPFAKHGDVIRMRMDLPASAFDLRHEDISSAAGMGEQVMQGDVLRDLRVWVVGQHLGQRRMQVELSRPHQLHHRHCREHFPHRNDAEARVERIASAFLSIGETIGALEQDRVPSRHHHHA
jgi:hypothetical protein